ncbi:MAG: phage tail protein [Parashewanella sp.]
MARLTTYGEEYVARCSAKTEQLIIDEFVFALLPTDNLHLQPEPANEPIPEPSKIVHRPKQLKYGVIDDNHVSFSQMLLANVGDFSFNWIGLVRNNQLVMFAYVPTTLKHKTKGGVEGNTITRNFTIEHLGIADALPVKVDAESWMYDYSNEIDRIQLNLVTNAVAIITANRGVIENAHSNMQLSERLRKLESKQ